MTADVVATDPDRFLVSVPGEVPVRAGQPAPTVDRTVPVKQLLRWQDDGGALPPGT